jgi:hypothetical protein
VTRDIARRRYLASKKYLKHSNSYTWITESELANAPVIEPGQKLDDDDYQLNGQWTASDTAQSDIDIDFNDYDDSVSDGSSFLYSASSEDDSDRSNDVCSNDLDKDENTDISDSIFSSDPRFVDSGWGGECLQEIEDIDFEFVYALHTFIATVEGQANATKGDTMVLLDDSNSYWWLVRVVKDNSIGSF